MCARSISSVDDPASAHVEARELGVAKLLRFFDRGIDASALVSSFDSESVFCSQVGPASTRSFDRALHGIFDCWDMRHVRSSCFNG